MASDAFTDTDGVALETHNGDWLELGFQADTSDVFVINTNAVYQAGTISCFARNDNETFSAAQNAQLTCVANGSDSGRMGPAVRINPTADGTGDAADVDGYGFAVRNFGSPNAFLYEVTNGSETILDSADITVATSDDYYLEIDSGSNLSAQQNTTEILTGIDSTHTSGQVGMYANNLGSTTFRMDDFVGNSAAAGGANPKGTFGMPFNGPFRRAIS